MNWSLLWLVLAAIVWGLGAVGLKIPRFDHLLGGLTLVALSVIAQRV